MSSRISYILLLAVCVLLITLTLSLDANFRTYVDDFREQQTVAVYLHSSASARQLETLINAIKRLPGYKYFNHQGKAAAFTQMQSLLGKQLLPDSDRNPFPDRIIVGFSAEHANLANFRDVAAILQSANVVDTVTYNGPLLAAQEQAFSRWHYIILGGLLMSIAAGIFALISSVFYAEEQHSAVLQALRLHGAGLGTLSRRFVGRWTGFALLATGLGIGLAYFTWKLYKSRFESQIFVDPNLLLILVGSVLGIAVVGLSVKLLRYR